MAYFKTSICNLLLLGVLTVVFGDECCKAHYVWTLDFNEEKWCSNYCCFLGTKYDCCDSIMLQAPASEREDFCSDYFDKHVWAAVLIAVGCIALVVGCCVCVCKVCCGRSQSVGVVVQPSNPGVTVVNSSNTTHQQPGYPSNTMQQPGYPSNTMQQPGYPSNTMQQQGYPSNTVQEPGYPVKPV